MHERISRDLLYAATNGKTTFVMTPLEQKEYESFCRDVASARAKIHNPEFYIPTSLPDSGVSFSYCANEKHGITREQVERFDDIAKKIIKWYENHGVVCEDGYVTIGLQDKDNLIHVKLSKNRDVVFLPSFGSAIEAKVTEELAYGLTAAVMNNFNSEDKYHNPWIEDFLCRLMSAVILKSFGFVEQSQAILDGYGCQVEMKSRAHEDWAYIQACSKNDEAAKIAVCFTDGAVIPFVRWCDYVIPEADQGGLNTEALRNNYPEVPAVQLFCDLVDAAEAKMDAHRDFVWGGAPE